MPRVMLEYGLQGPMSRPRPSSFWIDCSRLEGFSMVKGKIVCAMKKLAFKAKVLMDQMPFDQNCKAINFVLDRQKRQWYKCCMQAMQPLKCIEVQPTAWFSQRNEFGVSLPFNNEDAQMCFREKRHPDFNCPMAYCDNVKENCVTIGDLGKDASWLVPPKPKGKLAMLDKIKGLLAGLHMPNVQVLHFSVPEPLAALQALEPRRASRSGAKALRDFL
ncbi:unnamed protein product [Effrenium voratum]|uniref:Uncharacterized protein n=1 Tax=Effrenium voratum TaxID=2562239 RepID=A0AA36N1L2_9DINO|nr:unnamed protein product [Effrenium voratum]CAJ1437497.1 unnamed protein product [Effrenium voratum]